MFTKKGLSGGVIPRDVPTAAHGYRARRGSGNRLAVLHHRVEAPVFGRCAAKPIPELIISDMAGDDSAIEWPSVLVDADRQGGPLVTLHSFRCLPRVEGSRLQAFTRRVRPAWGGDQAQGEYECMTEHGQP